MRGAMVVALWLSTGCGGEEGEWRPISPAPIEPRYAVWSGDEAIVVGFYVGPGARYRPATDEWLSMAAPPLSGEVRGLVWTGDEAILWATGGAGDTPGGAAYDPRRDSWRRISAEGAPRLSSGYAAWTGEEMILWAGSKASGGAYFGGLYDPASDSWRPMNTDGYPDDASGGLAIWIGSEMLVWTSGPDPLGYRYHPGSDSWATAAVHRSIWLASVVAWSGREVFAVGSDGNSTLYAGRYDPVLDGWSDVTTDGGPEGDFDNVGGWVGGRLIVWGGIESDGVTENFQPVATGAVLDPAGGTWDAMATDGAPSARNSPSVLSTGDEMLVWGGNDETGEPVPGGARYRPGP